MSKRIELPPDRWAREWLSTLLTETASTTLVAELNSILVDFHPEGQRALLRAGWAEHDARDILPLIKVPTLLLYGDKDVRSPLEVARAMHANIPGSTLVIMQGVGQRPTWRRPTDSTPRFAGFFDRFTADDGYRAIRD